MDRVIYDAREDGHSGYIHRRVGFAFIKFIQFLDIPSAAKFLGSYEYRCRICIV